MDGAMRAVGVVFGVCGSFVLSMLNRLTRKRPRAVDDPLGVAFPAAAIRLPRFAPG